MAAAVTGVALIALVALLVAAAAGMIGTDFREGIWPVVGLLPLVGFPLAMMLILALLILATVRRARSTQSGSAR